MMKRCPFCDSDKGVCIRTYTTKRSYFSYSGDHLKSVEKAERSNERVKCANCGRQLPKDLSDAIKELIEAKESKRK